MTTPFRTPHNAMSALPAYAGHWPLGAGKALGLHARGASVLHIASGRVWATLDGPHPGPLNDQGDLALHAGDLLPVAAGSRVVIEPMDRSANQPVYFSFDPAPPATQDCVRGDCDTPTRWQATVLRPATQFAAAAAQALLALGGLLWGLASYAEFLAAGRGRVMGRFESNAP